MSFMSVFNDKLKEIRITELIIVVLLSVLFAYFSGIGGSWLLVFIVAYVFIRCRKGLHDLPSDIKGIYSIIPFRTCLLLLISNIILSMAFGFLTYYALTLLPDFNLYPGYEIEETAGVTLAYFITFIDVVLLTPLSEEFIFRGIILNRFNKRLPLIIAIILSSLIFGFMHGSTGLISAFIFGVCMCIVYIKTQNIFVSISIHFLNNLSGMLFDTVSNLPFFGSDIFLAAILILGIFSLAYVLRFCIRGYREITS